MKITLLSLIVALTLVAARPLRAQTGCTDSPEDPTVVLALVAGAGAIGTGLWRSRRSRR